MMPIPKRIPHSICLLALLLSSQSLIAQLGSQEHSATTSRFSHQYTFQEAERYYFIDTAFNSLHWYHQFNHSNSDLWGYSQFTNDGSPLLPHIPKNTFSADIWETYDVGPFQPYFNNAENIPYYQVRSPLTEANYWMGFERGQSFNFYHTQNITKNWNAFVNFRRLNSTGLYQNNRNEMSSFLFTTRYGDEESTYQMKAYIDFEKLEVSENGGLAMIDSFLNDPPSNRAVALVNLENDNRRYRKSELMIDQSVDILELFRHNTKNTDQTGIDTLQTDTTTVGSESVTAETPNDNSETASKAGIRLGHQSTYSRRATIYNSTASDFYENYFREVPNGSVVRDSFVHYSLDNLLYLETSIGNENSLDLRTGIRNLWTSYAGFGQLLTTNNLGVSGVLKGKLSDRLKLESSLDYLFAGSLSGNIDIYGQSELRIWKQIRAHGSYRFRQQYPDFFNQLYLGNNFAWARALKPQQENVLTLGLRWGKSNHLNYTISNYQNYTYYNYESRPAQSDDGLTVSQFNLTQNFTLWNFLHQDNDIIYQLKAGNTEVMPLPELLSRNSLYFEFELFNGALQCLVGAEVNYFSSYYAPEYNPALGRFYLQNEREVGNYPLVDAFANFKLEKARIFLKYGHVNQGLMAQNYLLTPSYIMPDRILRVGISWRFFN